MGISLPECIPIPSSPWGFLKVWIDPDGWERRDVIERDKVRLKPRV